MSKDTVEAHRQTTEHFRKAAYTAGLNAKDAKLIARANHVDNFTLWISGELEYAIIGALDWDNHDQVEWFNDYCRGDPPKHRKPLIIQVAEELHRYFNDDSSEQQGFTTEADPDGVNKAKAECHPLSSYDKILRQVRKYLDQCVEPNNARIFLIKDLAKDLVEQAKSDGIPASDLWPEGSLIEKIAESES